MIRRIVGALLYSTVMDPHRAAICPSRPIMPLPPSPLPRQTCWSNGGRP